MKFGMVRKPFRRRNQKARRSDRVCIRGAFPQADHVVKRVPPREGQT